MLSVRRKKISPKMVHDKNLVLPFVSKNGPFIGCFPPFIGPFFGCFLPSISGGVAGWRPIRNAPRAAIETGGARRQTGLTAVELMVTLAIVAILVTLAIPEWGAYVKKNRLVSTANDLLVAMNQARNEAVGRSVTVILCRSNNPTAASPTCGGTAKDWTPGWLVYATNGVVNERNYDPSTDELLSIGEAAPGIVTVTSDSQGDPWLGYNPDGMLTDGNNAAYAVCDDRGESAGKLILVPLTGRPGVSDTSSSDTAKDCTPT